MTLSLQEVLNSMTKKPEIIPLSLEDRKAFVKVLLNPPKSSARLLKATKRFLNEVKVKK
ncbi:MAG: DUF1778 domain-containing protein [Proteobacteria bacterium]|nr:DUF1778 domain-containing protein [Pseudomonadota bacterium]